MREWRTHTTNPPKDTADCGARNCFGGWGFDPKALTPANAVVPIEIAETKSLFSATSPRTSVAGTFQRIQSRAAGVGPFLADMHERFDAEIV
jgi:hypothetical protein